MNDKTRGTMIRTTINMEYGRKKNYVVRTETSRLISFPNKFYYICTAMKGVYMLRTRRIPIS